jgi:hypothetical protein
MMVIRYTVYDKPRYNEVYYEDYVSVRIIKSVTKDTLK